METILSVHDLCIQYEMQDGIVKALNGVDFELEEGSSHGLVGETGAGKTTMAKGIMGLTPKPYGKIKSGEILYHGKDLLKMGTKATVLSVNKDGTLQLQAGILKISASTSP